MRIVIQHSALICVKPTLFKDILSAFGEELCYYDNLNKKVLIIKIEYYEIYQQGLNQRLNILDSDWLKEWKLETVNCTNESMKNYFIH